MNKPGKMQTIKNRKPQSYEQQINEETYNIKINKQNKEQIKYADKNNLGKESPEGKKTNNINYKSIGKEKKIKSKINRKEENKIKDDYKTVTENIERSKVSKTANKRQSEEKHSGNIKNKKFKSKDAEEENEYSENDQKAQKYMNKDSKENSECEACNEGAKNEKYKFSKKQYKNKSGKKGGKKYKIKQNDDDIENNQEEDNTKQKINPKKQYKVIYYDETFEVDDQGFQEDIQKNEEKCKEYKPMFIKQKSTYELKFEEDNENVADLLKEKRKPKTKSVQHVTQKYEGTLEDCVKHFNPDFQEDCSDFITYKNKVRATNEDTLQEGNEKTGKLRKPLMDEEIYITENEEEMIIKKENIDINGIINIDTKETKYQNRDEIIKAPEGITAEQYEKIENLDMLKDSKLKLLRKYMLVELTNNEENLDKSKAFTNKNDKTFESQETNESNPNLKIFMYIVEEADNDHEIKYSIEEDDGEIHCSLPEKEEEEEEGVEIEVNWL